MTIKKHHLADMNDLVSKGSTIAELEKNIRCTISGKYITKLMITAFSGKSAPLPIKLTI